VGLTISLLHVQFVDSSHQQLIGLMTGCARQYALDLAVPTSRVWCETGSTCVRWSIIALRSAVRLCRALLTKNRSPASNCPIFACSVFTSTGGSFDGAPAAPKHICYALLQLTLSFRDLVQMHIELLRQFGQPALAFDRCQHHLRFNAAECVRQVLFAISSVPLPALSLAQATCPLVRICSTISIAAGRDSPDSVADVIGYEQRAARIERNADRPS
jgi:hypothetical protein